MTCIQPCSEEMDTVESFTRINLEVTIDYELVSKIKIKNSCS